MTLTTPAEGNPSQNSTITEEPQPLPQILEKSRSDPEKSAGDGDASIEVHSSAVEHVYLTFESQLPPEIISPPSTSISPPDLSKYASPFKWESRRKTTTLILSCVATFLSAYSAGSYSMTSDVLRLKWGLSNVGFSTGVTAWATSFGLSPMFLAPLSEINGRRPLFLASGLIFFVGQIGCAATESFAGMLVCRVLVGAGASTFSTMVGGVISDVYHTEDRNTPMSIYSGFALAGTGFGPMISGFIVTRVSWRWVFYHQAIALGFVLLLLILFFQETRGSVLLSRRAGAINTYLDQLETSNTNANTNRRNIRYKVAADENRSSIGRMIYLSLTIPFKLLATEPVVFFFSMWAAFAWAVLYMTFSVLPLVFTDRHNFTLQQNGAVFSAIGIGSIAGTFVSVYQEKLAKRFWPKLTTTPEGRLYFACLESAFLPIGLFWFGWTSFSSIPWISPVLAIGFAQMGIFSIYLAVFNYLADVYHRYASSALAGQSFCRNILAAVFPLFTNLMFKSLTFPGASSLLGGISALLTLVPWVLVFKGESIRARSKIAREILVNGS